MNTNPQPVLDPAFWRERLQAGGPRSAIYHCTDAEWERHEQRHRAILAKMIGWRESVLDVGCGYGRLIDLLPKEWASSYLGIDLSPELVSEAARQHPLYPFVICDVRNYILPGVLAKFDWAVCVSLKHTIIGNCGLEVWERVERVINRMVSKILYLEFDLNEEPDYGVPRL
jgi:SAM-dependent methyltransferase